MAARSVTDICVLLVDADPRSSKKTLELLLDAEYRVVMASGGDEALTTLRRKQRKVDLVVTRTNLPDFCAYKLVQILNTEFKIAVVIICENDHETTVLRGLLYGAMFCLSDPLCTHDIEILWQHVIRKRLQLQESSESKKRSVGIYEERLLKRFLRSSARGDSSQIREPKISVPDKVDGWVMGLPVSFNWNIEFHWKLLDAIVGTGVDVAVPSKVLRLIGSPGLTMQSVTDKLQQYQMCLRGHQNLTSKRIIYDHEPSSQIVEAMMARGSSTSEKQPPTSGFLSNAKYRLRATVIRRRDDPAEEIILI